MRTCRASSGLLSWVSRGALGALGAHKVGPIGLTRFDVVGFQTDWARFSVTSSWLDTSSHTHWISIAAARLELVVARGAAENGRREQPETRSSILTKIPIASAWRSFSTAAHPCGEAPNQEPWRSETRMAGRPKRFLPDSAICGHLASIQFF